MELDHAYANAAYIPDGDSYPAKWQDAAAAFRQTVTCELDLAYGETPRQRFDLFHPNRLAKGLVVFVHGGYWLRFDKSYWSHLAAGSLAGGWAVAMPSYDLCPSVRITNIGEQVARAVAVAADRVPGPIRLVGHSAGGHLVARVSVPNASLHWQKYLERSVSVSPVADLAPLMLTTMNVDLRIDTEEALRESPVHLPRPAVPVTTWVGADERPVFLEQAQALVESWSCHYVVESAQNHFTVIEALASHDSPLTQEVLS